MNKRYRIERLDNRVEVYVRGGINDHLFKLVALSGSGCCDVFLMTEPAAADAADIVHNITGAFRALVDALEECDREKQNLEHDLENAKWDAMGEDL